jgi:hypothetical protein
VAAPVVVYLIAVWTLHIRPYEQLKMSVPYSAAAVLVLLTPLTPAPARLTALLLAVLVATTVIVTRRRQGAARTVTDH